MLRQAIENARLMYIAQTADDPIVQMVQKFAEALFDYAATNVRFADRLPSTISDAETQQLDKDAKAQFDRVNDYASQVCAFRATTDEGRAAKIQAFEVYSDIMGKKPGQVPELDFARSIMDDTKAAMGLRFFMHSPSAPPAPAPAAAPAPRSSGPSMGGR